MTPSAASSPSGPGKSADQSTLSSVNPSSPRRRSRRGPPRRRSHPQPIAKPEPAVLAYEPSPFDPAPIPFDKLSLDERLLSGIRDLGWADTRPVQSGVIPLALGSSDVIACAETGTGKTAAFLVPILQRFLHEQTTGEGSGARRGSKAGTRALILAPTRELAVQIEDQVQGLTYHTSITSAAVYGGVPMLSLIHIS